MKRMGEIPIDIDRRNEILRLVASGRGNSQGLVDRIEVIPAWLDKPMRADQPTFDAAFREYQRTDPIVTSLEQRLVQEPGPVWRDLSAQEKEALGIWSTSVDSMASIAKKYFPSDTERDLKKVALALIGLGAFALPILLSPKESSGIRLWPRAPEFPSGPVDTRGLTTPRQTYQGLPRSTGTTADVPVFSRSAASSTSKYTFRSPSADRGAFSRTGPGLPRSAGNLPAPSGSDVVATPSGAGRFTYRRVKKD